MKGLTMIDLRMLRYMLFYSTPRGTDATGIGFPNMNLWKAPIESTKAIYREDFKRTLRGGKGQLWVIGHVRRATKQSTIQKNINNHPLLIKSAKGEFMLTHNGIVGSRTIRTDPDKTDSYIIAGAIAKHFKRGDLVGTVQRAYREFWGSATIAVTTRTQLVLGVRTNPMVVARMGDAYVYCSQLDIMKYARNKLRKEVNKKRKHVGANRFTLRGVHFHDSNTFMSFNSQGKIRHGKLPLVKTPENSLYEYGKCERKRKPLTRQTHIWRDYEPIGRPAEQYF